MRSRLMQIALILFLLVCSAFGQTTTITGTIDDLTVNPVTSGKVVFTLKPSVDTTISGNARFTPGQPVTCYIQSNGTLLNATQSGACTVVTNTSLTPAGTSYRVDICPYMACSSSFNFYAINGSYNISTIVPTPTTGPAQNFADVFSNQTIGGNKSFTGTTVFSSSVSGCTYNGAPYVGSSCYPTVLSAISALTGNMGRIYIQPGTYAGPVGSQIGSNQEFICAAPPLSAEVAGSFSSHYTAVDQCVFSYSTSLTLLRLWNVHFSGIVFNFGGLSNQAGLVIKESQQDIFDDSSVVEAGNFTAGVPAVLLTSATSGYNTSHIIFRNFNIDVNTGAIGMQLAGTGTVNAGPSVTDDTFFKLLCTGNWLYCLDFEENTDTNYVYGLEGNEIGSAPSNSALLAFNVGVPASDEDADNEYISGAFVTGAPTYMILAGQSSAEVFLSMSTCPTNPVQVLGGTPNITVHGMSFFGTPTCNFFANSVAIGTATGHYATIHGVLSNSGSLTFGLIGGNTCSEQTMTVTGASTTGSSAWASENAALGNINLSWSAWVSATNTVSVRICNVTAGGITPNAVTWTAWVIQ